MRFIDLFAGLGGFHRALAQLGHECVFASEIDEELRNLYNDNFSGSSRFTYGDIRQNRDKVPKHDILCAGFPCQPFSKSGYQLGLQDETHGTLFDEIVYILKSRRPEYVILENVGNFERHDSGRTWQIVKRKLQALGYDVRGTEHITSGGPGLISPHHFGFPHTRERFFIVGRLGGLQGQPFPAVNRDLKTSLDDIVQSQRELSSSDRNETRLTDRQRACIKHWNSLLAKLPIAKVHIPSFPIWGDEIDATYPFEQHTPYAARIDELRRCLNGRGNHLELGRNDLLKLLPSYARVEQEVFPKWKVDFIKRNREWFATFRQYFTKKWVDTLKAFPPSLRKLEWNCQGEERDLWRYVLQFRPSGLRVKRYNASPALVAMTTTQIPILGPKQRFLSRIEGLRLQGFPDNYQLPSSRAQAFRALGNAVHVGVIEAIAANLLAQEP